MATGVCKIYDCQKGWGFITPDGGGADVFVHVYELNASGIEDGLKPGDVLAFELTDSTHKKARPGDKKASKLKRI